MVLGTGLKLLKGDCSVCVCVCHKCADEEGGSVVALLPGQLTRRLWRSSCEPTCFTAAAARCPR